MRLCFYVIRAFLPSLPGGRRYTHPGVKLPPVCSASAISYQQLEYRDRYVTRRERYVAICGGGRYVRGSRFLFPGMLRVEQTGVQSEPDCSSTSYLPTRVLLQSRSQYVHRTFVTVSQLSTLRAPS